MNIGIATLPSFAGEGLVNVVVETAKGTNAKLKYEPERGLFKLHKILPKGFTFPYDFGFIPGTLGGDGDPIDVLVLAEAGTIPGCVIEARPIGVVKLTKDGQRNDRIIAVWPSDVMYGKFEDFTELPTLVAIELERFFRLYPVVHGERVEFLGCEGAADAVRVVKRHVSAGRSQSPGKGLEREAQALPPPS